MSMHLYRVAGIVFFLFALDSREIAQRLALIALSMSFFALSEIAGLRR